MDLSTLYQLYLQYPVITTDSRHCSKNSLFFALKGDNFNGNAFAEQALQAGCAYAIVDEKQYAEINNPRILLVENTLLTLQQLANYHRKQLATPIIGITGTNGKTTTKELISTILSQNYKVLYTEGNLNNHIGVPLTLLRLTPEHELAVVEMGANHPGEIRTLANIAEPNYGIITNVGKAHLEGFGSFEGVIQTKGELYDFLRKRADSTVFISYENSYLNQIAQGLNLVSYGKTTGLYISGQLLSNNPFLAFQWKEKNIDKLYNVQTHLIGAYNLENALAAIAIGRYFKLPPQQINYALENYLPQNNRSQLKKTASNNLIIDAYNANPTSMLASLENFNQINASHKMLILGDMKELGKTSQEEHQKIIDFIQTCHFEKVILVGNEFSSTRHSYETYRQVQDLIKILQKRQLVGKYILIKGSNSMKLNTLTEYL